MRTFTLAVAFVLGLAPIVFADAGDDAAEGRRWGISLWGLSYHVNRSIDYNEANLGVGVRYYFNRQVFVEGDALRNSNRGVVLPVSAGFELWNGSLGRACHVSALAALTAAYYQNGRTETNYYRVGPVPGAVVSCGRVKTNVMGILSPSRQPVAAIVASLTILVGSARH